MNSGAIGRVPLVESFYSLQGEGCHTGTAAYFIRLCGCDTGCPWCDSEYARDPDNSLPTTIDEIVGRAVVAEAETIVITGGEPTMHDLQPLTEALHRHGMKIFLETAGTHTLRGEFDWICLSPKQIKHPTDEAFERADELKVVISDSDDLRWAEECAAKVRPECKLFLQPEWNGRAEAMPVIIEYIKRHPKWRLSLQTHKYIDIP